MARTRQWYYDGTLIGGATGKTHVLTAGQTDSDLIECRTEVTYGADAVAALAEYAAAAAGITVGNNIVHAIAGGTASATYATPSGMQENDILLVAASADEQIYDDGVTQPFLDMTSFVGIDEAINEFPGTVVAYKRMGVTPDTTITVDATGISGTKQMNVLMQVYRGVNATTAEDTAHTESSGSTLLPDPPSITTVTNGALVVAIGVLDDDNSANMTVPSGYTNPVYHDSASLAGSSLSLGSKIVATAGAEDPGAFGGTGDDGHRSYTIAFRPA